MGYKWKQIFRTIMRYSKNQEDDKTGEDGWWQPSNKAVLSLMSFHYDQYF